MQAQSQGKFGNKMFSVLNLSMGKIEEELRSQRAPERNAITFRYLQDTFSSEERGRDNRLNSHGDSEPTSLMKGIPSQKLIVKNSNRDSPQSSRNKHKSAIR